MDIKSLMRENIRNLAPYSTARDEYQGEPLEVYIDANESPYNNGYNRYPDPHQRVLKARLSQIKGVPTEQIFVGNGSDEAIDLLFRVFCEPRLHNAVAIAPSYGMYEVAAETNDVQMRKVALEADFSLDTEKLIAATDSNTRLVWICSPNNPSGNTFPLAQIEEILSRVAGIVVIDEAYIDFAQEPSYLTRLGQHPNLVVLQTLSKAWGMAGLRLGLAFAGAEIIEVMNRVKYPYNINVITQSLVLKQLENSIEEQVEEIISERKRVEQAMDKMSLILHRFPSEANFILVRVERPRELYNALLGAGIIVRDRSRIAGCEGCLRISIGTPTENNKLIETLKNIPV